MVQRFMFLIIMTALLSSCSRRDAKEMRVVGQVCSEVIKVPISASNELVGMSADDKQTIALRAATAIRDAVLKKLAPEKLFRSQHDSENVMHLAAHAARISGFTDEQMATGVQQELDILSYIESENQAEQSKYDEDVIHTYRTLFASKKAIAQERKRLMEAPTPAVALFGPTAIKAYSIMASAKQIESGVSLCADRESPHTETEMIGLSISIRSLSDTAIQARIHADSCAVDEYIWREISLGHIKFSDRDLGSVIAKLFLRE